VLRPSSPGFAFYMVTSNVTHPVLQDKRVRQAMNFAMNRKRMSDEILAGLSPTMTLVFPEYSPGYDADLAKSYTYDLKQAKALLDQAGYSASNAPVLPLSYSAGPVSEATFTILKNDLDQIGLKSQLDLQDGAAFTKALYIDRSVPGSFTGLLGYAGMQPATFLLGRIRPPNYMHYDSAQFNQFLDQTFDQGNVQATQKTAMQAFNKLMLDESFMIPIMASIFPHLMTSKVHGFNLNVVDDIRLEEIWLG
jgi:peptide/nickel transport system substrate-binding protein